MLIMYSSEGGKTFMAQMFLLMLGRLSPLISIIERGDSYAALTELMGGRVIDVDLEGSETLNPWDLPPGQLTPGKDKSHQTHDRRGSHHRFRFARHRVERCHHACLSARRKPADKSSPDFLGPSG